MFERELVTVWPIMLGMLNEKRGRTIIAQEFPSQQAETTNGILECGGVKDILMMA